MDESKHEIHSQVDAITAGTASVVNLTAGERLSDESTGSPMLYGKGIKHLEIVPLSGQSVVCHTV